MWAALVLGILAIPLGGLIGAESGFDGPPVPRQQSLRRKALATAMMFTGAGLGIAAALGLYLAGRRKNRSA
jgi:hypothetical protein